MMASLMGFEMRYHFKQIVFQVTAALFFFLGALMPHGSFGGPEILKNGPYVINFIICLLSIFMIFVSALFCANVVLRDKSYQTDVLIFSTAISKRVYFGIKLFGLLLSVSLIICIAAAGILVGTVWLPASQKGSFQLLYYLQPLLLFGLPNALFCASFVFAAAMWSQNARAVYASGVLLFILYFTASIFGNSPLMATSALKTGGPGLWSVLADPFGLTTFFSELKSWSVWRRNHHIYAVTGTFLSNRLLWTCMAVLAVTLSYKHFRFSSASARPVDKSKAFRGKIIKVVYRPVALQKLGFVYYISALRSQLLVELTSLFRQQLFVVLLALWIFVYGVELDENVLHGPYDIRFYGTTALVIEQILSARMALLLLVFYASELIHKEQVSRIQSLVFSTPVSDAVLFLAKFGSLAVLISILISCNIITGIGFQFLTGQTNISLLPYFSLFYYSGFQLLLFTVLIIFIQTIIPNKYLGMLLSLLVLGIYVFGKMLGIEQYLLRFGSAPQVIYSAINGFGHHAESFNGYMLFWTFFAITLGMLASRWWQNGRVDTWWKRMKAGMRNWDAASKIMIVSTLMLMICTGFYIIEKSDGVALGRGSKKDIQWQKRYEKTYMPIAALTQPVITKIKIKTDIYPDEQRYEVSGTYHLMNKSTYAISKLWIGVDPSVTLVVLTMAGAALKRSDQDLKQYFYDLKKPLLPGAVMLLNFSIRVDRSSFKPFESENSVVSNGSYIELEKFLPFLGYNNRFELDDPRIRQKNGMEIQTKPTQTHQRYHLVDFENTISTLAGQQVVSVGNLEKSWKIGGRSYFLYKTVKPIAFMLAISSMRYDVHKKSENGITFQIFYQPGQTHNLPAMMQAMKDAISYGNAQFSPYPLKQITLAEIPAYPGAATAYPGVIFSSEKYNFLVDASDTSRLNFIYTTTAHETAHQWWAYKIRPQNGFGNALLTESLAKYTEAMVAEKRMGKMRLRQYLRTDNELYFTLRNRSAQKELPLSQTWEQPFVHYQKGGLEMYAIRELLGEDRVNAALKNLIFSHSFPNIKPSSNDLVNALSQQATPFEKTAVENRLRKVIVYDNSIKVLSLKTIGDGRFRLKLLVTVHKIDEADFKPKKMQTDDLMDIGIFGAEERFWKESTEPIYFRRHHFIKPQTVIEIVIDRQPKVVAIDPYGYFLDGDQKNNMASF
ncbi:ABC transporter permease/M1 family aminopeptidase [Dyadobacter psychrotolerans]|uniref:Peptidase M1 membrane alanine aminopeptidase domain-containing protein n=1 Tax=Dyadobacter psychrotolerans TaxID=2541721 RepID=A0A4R5D817_9BACT|nr:M1 family aminopeptidase [Dyadobacter psychrotolerans]TDE09576.1 hypothetical protein E0F88_30270 [Dyadobacter psychrotolerans]